MPDFRVPVGAWASLREQVTRAKTVAHFHEGMPEVYGTPMMIYLMELTASKALEPYLPEGWISVGAAVHVEHLAATPVGFTVVTRAEVLSWDGKLVTFSVEAHDGREKIGAGTHVRAPVEQSRFLKGMARKAAEPPSA